MRVKIFTEYGINIGYGHLFRQYSIAQVFRDKNIDVEFFLYSSASYNSPINDFKLTYCDWIKDSNILKNSINKSDIVFIDSYLAHQDLYVIASKLSHVLVSFDDYNRIKYPQSYVVNGTISAESINYDLSDKKVKYLLGPEYQVLRKEFTDIFPKEIKKKVSSIMVTFGGDDSMNLTPSVLSLLNEKYSSLKKYIVAGSLFKNIEEIIKIKDYNSELVLDANASKMLEIMSESDIAVSSCGQTLFELSRVGVPTIGIVVAKNQIENAKGWVARGFLDSLIFGYDKDFINKVEILLDKFSNVVKRNAVSIAGINVCNGKGAENIIDQILN